MVKAGVFLVARMNPVFASTGLWGDILLVFGGYTMFLGAFLSLKQTDLKRILAYTTLSVLGTLMMLTGYGTEAAYKTMVIYLTAHSLYKGALFLTAGAIDHATGTRDVRLLGGLAGKMPVTAFAGIAAALSMSGVIPFIGFIGKEYLYSTSLEGAPILFFAVLFTGVAMVYSAIQSGIHPWFGKKGALPKEPHEGDFTLFTGPVVASAASLILGLFATLLISPLASMAVTSIYGVETSLKTGLWHGFNVVFLLSLATLAAGYGLYKMREKLFLLPAVYGPLEYLMPSKLYDKALKFLVKTSKWQTSFFQNGYLRYYIITIFFTALLIAGGYFVHYFDISAVSIDTSAGLHEIFVGIAMVSGAVIAAVASSRLFAVLGLGITGAGAALVFVMYGAPDLALTQFAIETLSVILFVLAIYKLPGFLKISNKGAKIRDLAIASSAGVFVVLLILAVYSLENQTLLKDYFAQNSVPGGMGRNIVNVILVDFRSIDTMGEITVLGIAAIGIYGLVKLVKRDG